MIRQTVVLTSRTHVIPAPVIPPQVKPSMPRRKSFHADFAMTKAYMEKEEVKYDEETIINNRGGVRRRASIRNNKYTK